MGSSPSTNRPPSPHQQEQESLAASTASLSSLKSAFANLSNPNSQSIPLSSLHHSLSISPETLTLILPPHHQTLTLILLPHLGPSLANLFFTSEKIDFIDWLTFVSGFNRCCARAHAFSSIVDVYRVFSDVCKAAGVDCGLEFDLDDDGGGGKVGGVFRVSDLMMFLGFCWVMEQSLRLGKGGKVVIPDLSSLVFSAILDCDEVGSDGSFWGLEELGDGKVEKVQKVNGWILRNVPGIASCLSQFVKERIKFVAVSAVC